MENISSLKLKLRTIGKWSVIMEKSKKDSNKPARDSHKTDDRGIEDSENQDTGRRLQDTYNSEISSRHLNFDRRVKRSDRRSESNPQYKGPVRRYKIDSRKLKDRRDKD
jgi:hypothetical protein